MRRVRAAVAHQVPRRAPLRVIVGERVQVGERDTEWPAFRFVVAERGEGWVPERYLDVDRGSAVVRVAYDTTELPTEAGDVLDVVEDDVESGWVWCRNERGVEGWVPGRTVVADSP